MDNKLRFITFTSMYKMNKYIVALLCVTTLIVSCQRDRDIPGWDVDVTTPIISSNLDLGDMVGDSNVVVLENVEVLIRYRQKILEYGLRELVPPFDYTLTENFSLQSLSLGDQLISERVSLGSIAAEAGLAGNLIIAANGSSIIIPALPPLAASNFPIDAGEYFESLTLIEGDIEITFENNLPIQFNDVGYELVDLASNTIIVSDTIPVLLPGQSITKLESLDGATVGSQLEARLSDLYSPGSNGNAVQIDTSDALDVTVRIFNLQPYEATAYWPAQDLINDTPDVVLTTAGDLDLTFSTIRSGDIFLEMVSTIDDTIYFTFKIPESYLAGQSYVLNQKIPPAPPGGINSISILEDFSGYTLDLTGKDGNQTSTFYDIIIARIDSSGELVNLSLEDSLVFNAGIQSMVMNYAEGSLGNDTIEGELETSTLEEFSNIGADILKFGFLKLGLEIENNIGADARFEIEELRMINPNTGESEELNTTISGNTIDISRASRTAQAPYVNPTYSEIFWTSNNSNINDIVEIIPKVVEYRTNVYLNPDATGPTNDFIYYDHPLKAYFIAEIPLHFEAGNFNLVDTLDFDWSSIDAENRINGGELHVFVKNGFPLTGNFSLHLLDENGNASEIIVTNEKINSAYLDTDGRVTAKYEHQITLTLDEAMLEALKNASQIALSARFDTPLDGQKIKIYDDCNLDVQLSGAFDFRLN